MGNPLDVILEPSEARGSGKWPINGFEDQKYFGNLPGEFLKLWKVEGDSQSPRNTWQDTEAQSLYLEEVLAPRTLHCLAVGSGPLGE